jgi:hypothetical protein
LSEPAVWRTAGEKIFKKTTILPPASLKGAEERQELLKTAFFSLFAKQKAVQALRVGAGI